MKRILIVGDFGLRRRGDEILLASIIGQLRTLDSSLHMEALSADPAETQRLQAIPAIRFNDLPAVTRAIHGSDALVLAGLIQDAEGCDPGTFLTPKYSGLTYYASVAVLARLMGKPFGLWSVGISPLVTESARRFTAALFEESSFASVRDEETTDLLRQTGFSRPVAVFPDPAFTLTPLPLDSPLPRKRPCLAVCLRNWHPRPQASTWENEMVRGLQLFLERTGGEALLLPFQRLPGSLGDELSQARRMVEALGPKISAGTFEEEASAAQLSWLLGQCDVILGMRRHALIFATTHGVPFVSLSPGPQDTSLFSSLGLQDLSLDSPPMRGQDLAEALLRALEHRGDLKERLRSFAKLQKERASRAAPSLLAALEGSPASDPVPWFRAAAASALARRLAEPTGTLPQTELMHTGAAGGESRKPVTGGTGFENDRIRFLESELRNVKLAQAAREKSYRDQIEALSEENRSTREKLEEDLRKALHSAQDVRRTGEMYRQQLMSIYNSRLWRAGSLYWTLLRKLGLVKERASPQLSHESLSDSRQVLAVLKGANGPGGGQSEFSDSARQYPKCPVARENAIDIVCFPIIEWSFRFQRPQQLMKQFARAGHRVFYISSEFRRFGEPYEIKEQVPNLYEVSLRGPKLHVYREFIGERHLDSLFFSLNALRRDCGLGATAAIVQLPFWWMLAERARAKFAWPVIYDCMDHHAGFSTNDRSVLERERAVFSGADAVVVSSLYLEKEARALNKNVTLVPNACEYEHFEGVETRGVGNRPRIGYYGAIADWFDSNLVADLAKRRPDWDFLLVGSTYGADLSRLSKLPNVQLMGEVDYADLPAWISRMDVCLIPFKRTPLTEATNPVKAYEILAAGKPLISVPLPEVAVLGDLVRLASDAPGFEKEIEAALSETGGAALEKRRAFARQQTWKHRREAMLPAIHATFPRASIVIVTYNNLEWNRICLETLYGRTEWPNFEVFVIDNASKDGTPAFLREAAKTYPRLDVVLNTANKGFSGGTNQGLVRAKGDFIVLLNNDTSVARGWLSALIRHLTANPRIGLIGPVTNEIGNEAKIPAGYADLAQMPDWASRFTRENDGILSPISMLAMFCVVMRREVLETIGFLDERFGIGMFEDDDYSRRVRAEGYDIRFARDSFIHHAGRASFKLLGDAKYMEIFEKNRALYQEKWGLWRPHVNLETKAKIPAFQQELRYRIVQSGIEASRIIVFLPSIGWNIALVQRPQHLAREFVRQGYFVIYDCTGSAADTFGGFEEVEKNLLLFNGPIEILEALENPLIWAFSYNASLVDQWPRCRVLYDFIDDLEVFPYSQKELKKNHERMLKEAEKVFCVSKKLLQETLIRRADAVYLPNAVEYERFEALTAPEPLLPQFVSFAGRFSRIAGYYGAIADWMDVNLIVETARLRPDWGFVLIGFKLAGAPSLRTLEKASNVLIMDAQKYENLPGYLARFTVAFIPFKVNAITEATSPLKLYEYFAGGKPVITTPMPECSAYEDVLIVGNASQFTTALDTAARRAADPAFVARVKAIGEKNSWKARVQEVRSLLEDTKHEAPIRRASNVPKSR